jgi:hypothetical protein
MANAVKSGEGDKADAGLTTIAECIATYLAIGNKRLSIKPLSVHHNVHLAHRSFYGDAPPEYRPSPAELDRIRQKIVTYFPWQDWLAEQSLSWTPKALQSIRSICYFACFPPTPAVTNEERLNYPPTLAEFPRKAWLDQTIDEIPVSARLAIDRDVLKEDLQLCLICYRIESQLGSKARFGNRAEHLAKIRNSARQLFELLSIDADAWNKMGIDWVFPEVSLEPLFMHYAGCFPPEFDQSVLATPDEHHFLEGPLLATLKCLIEETDRLLSDSVPAPPLRDRRTPIERFLGKNLPMIFEAHFGLKAGGGAGGPYSRFSQGVLQMMRESVAPRTIVSAISDVRKNQFRRKDHKPKPRD